MNLSGFCTLIVMAVFSAMAFGAKAQHASPASGSFEFGLIAGGLSYPPYPASAGRNNRVLVLPYIKYEGSQFSLGGKSIAAVHLAKSERVQFDISLNASFDASSSGIAARAGMPKLDYIFEAGPVMEYQLGTVLGGDAELRLPIRAVVATDFRTLSVIGATFSPSVRVKWTLNPTTRTEVEATLQPVFATEGVQDYFYQVDPAFATGPRPAYNAAGGYLGSELVVSLGHSLSPSLRLYGYAKLGLYQGAVNQDSPLFGSNNTVTVGVALRKTLNLDFLRRS